MNKQTRCDCGGYETYGSYNPVYHSSWCKINSVTSFNNVDDTDTHWKELAKSLKEQLELFNNIGTNKKP